jgi:hypothetical protein
MELIIDFNTFKLQIERFVEQGKAIQEKKATSEEELEQLKTEKKEWEKSCSTFLKESFKGESNDYFANGFLESSEFNLGYKLPMEQLLKNLKDNLMEKCNRLQYYVRLLGISDAFINPELVRKENRENWTVNQKKTMLLKKLKQLNDGKYYDVDYIFWSNGIGVNNDDEPRQIAKSLEHTFLKVMGRARGVSALITIKGIEYLENLEEEQIEAKKQTTNNATKEDIENIHKRFDEVKEWLNKNNLASEIIFDELQEMKEAGEKLSLKNWKQLLKGKLFDLTTDGATDFGVDAAKNIFKIFTGEDFNKFLD